jgi:hypothetical protein
LSESKILSTSYLIFPRQRKRDNETREEMEKAKRLQSERPMETNMLGKSRRMIKGGGKG